MKYYKICGLKIASDFVLEAAEPVRDNFAGKCDLKIHEGYIDDTLFNINPPREQDEFLSLSNHQPNISNINVIGHGCFIVQNGNEIIYRLKDGHDPLLIAETIYCICLSIVIIQRGQFMIHGGGVLINDKVVIIGGGSGTGKSTLTETLLRTGAVFMADDFVALSMEDDMIWAHPAYPQRKLLADAAERFGYDKSKLILLPTESGPKKEEKYAFRFTEGFCKEKKPLGALVVLYVSNDAKTGEIAPVSGSEKLKYVVHSLYGHQTYRWLGLQREQFLACAQIANKIPVFSLTRPPSGFSPREMADLLYDCL